MLIFAFNVLCFALLGVAAFFAYRWTRTEFARDIKRIFSFVRLNAAGASKRIAQLEARIDELEAQARQETVELKPPQNLFTKSEQRHIDESRKMPTVVGMRGG